MSSPSEINENVTGTQPVTDTSTHNLNDNPDPVLDEQKEPDAPAEQHEEKATDEAKEVVLAAHNGGTERLRALLEADPNLVDSVRRYCWLKSNLALNLFAPALSDSAPL